MEHRILAVCFRRFVAIVARHRDVAASQNEPRLLVTRQIEARSMERGLVVALLAAIVVRGPRELPVVHILMATDTGRDLDHEDGGFAGGNVALRALHIDVLFLQREIGRLMIGHRVFGRLEPCHGMARLASPAVGARHELPAVRIGLVAIAAIAIGDLGLEVSIAMASKAGDILMFALQRILGFGMVEFRDVARPFPTRRAVTRFARLFEFAFMHIGVTGRTAVKFQTDVFRHATLAGSVTLGAFHLHVCAGQGIFRLRMVKGLRVFPVGRVVALLAVGTELPFVLVFMAGSTALRQSKIRAVNVLHLDRSPLDRTDVFCGVALVTGEAGVFSVQRKSGFCVIKLGWGRVPTHKHKLAAIMV